MVRMATHARGMLTWGREGSSRRKQSTEAETVKPQEEETIGTQQSIDPLLQFLPKKKWEARRLLAARDAIDCISRKLKLL